MWVCLFCVPFDVIVMCVINAFNEPFMKKGTKSLELKDAAPYIFFFGLNVILYFCWRAISVLKLCSCGLNRTYAETTFCHHYSQAIWNPWQFCCISFENTFDAISKCCAQTWNVSNHWITCNTTDGVMLYFVLFRIHHNLECIDGAS